MDDTEDVTLLSSHDVSEVSRKHMSQPYRRDVVAGGGSCGIPEAELICKIRSFRHIGLNKRPDKPASLTTSIFTVPLSSE
jgi:hypothetical protein